MCYIIIYMYTFEGIVNINTIVKNVSIKKNVVTFLCNFLHVNYKMIAIIHSY